MRREDIRELTRAIPFRPFRLFLTNGEKYSVRHPEMLIPSWGAIRVSLETIDSGIDEPDDSVLISLIHIIKIEYFFA